MAVADLLGVWDLTNSRIRAGHRTALSTKHAVRRQNGIRGAGSVGRFGSDGGTPRTPGALRIAPCCSFPDTSWSSYHISVDRQTQPRPDVASSAPSLARHGSINNDGRRGIARFDRPGNQIGRAHV